MFFGRNEYTFNCIRRFHHTLLGSDPRFVTKNVQWLRFGGGAQSEGGDRFKIIGNRGYWLSTMLQFRGVAQISFQIV